MYHQLCRRRKKWDKIILKSERHLVCLFSALMISTIHLYCYFTHYFFCLGIWIWKEKSFRGVLKWNMGSEIFNALNTFSSGYNRTGSLAFSRVSNKKIIDLFSNEDYRDKKIPQLVCHLYITYKYHIHQCLIWYWLKYI